LNNIIIKGTLVEQSERWYIKDENNNLENSSDLLEGIDGAMYHRNHFYQLQDGDYVEIVVNYKKKSELV
jgi:hypothetical protein